jgi:hypothetical protein
VKKKLSEERERREGRENRRREEDEFISVL